MAEEEDDSGRKGGDGSERDSSDKDDTNQDNKQGKENQPRTHKFSLILKSLKKLSPKSPTKIALRTIRSNQPSPGGSPSSNSSQRSVRVRKVHTISTKASFSSLQRPRLAELAPPRNADDASPCSRRGAVTSKTTRDGSMGYMDLCDEVPLSDTQWPDFISPSRVVDVSAMPIVAKDPPCLSSSSDLIFFTPNPSPYKHAEPGISRAYLNFGLT